MFFAFSENVVKVYKISQSHFQMLFCYLSVPLVGVTLVNFNASYNLISPVHSRHRPRISASEVYDPHSFASKMTRRAEMKGVTIRRGIC